MQQRAFDVLADLTETDPRNCTVGNDGCGFPAPTMPLARLARAAARFAKPTDLRATRASAIRRLHAALAANPYYAAGHGTIVSALVAVTHGRILAKTGAEGVLIAMAPERGLGVALKIADGAARPRATALLAILDHLDLLSKAELLQLHDFITPSITNSRDEIVGEMRHAGQWLSSPTDRDAP